MKSGKSFEHASERWWAVKQKKRCQGRSQSVHVSRSAPIGADAGQHIDSSESMGDITLELALKHFEDQRLKPEEAEMLSTEILVAVNEGSVRHVGPVGRRRRRYEINRQSNALSVRAGEGRISLHLTSAVRLAGMLGDTNFAATSRICA